MAESTTGRAATVGGMDVVRVLPTRRRRTVGPWCFVDLMSPDAATDPDPMEVGPHPHIGLSTVTWLLEGEAVHSDSLGTEQPLRPGELNLMSAGHGIAHAEQVMERGPFRGVQLWLVQPAGTREEDAAFEHHGELPEVGVGNGVARVLIGAFDDVEAPTRQDVATLGLDMQLRPGATTLPLDPTFEHVVVPLDGRVVVEDVETDVGGMVHLPAGAEHLTVGVPGDGRFLVLGGEPFEERVLMWWNFVARDREEIEQARRSWQRRDDRFAAVPSPLARIDAPPLPWR